MFEKKILSSGKKKLLGFKPQTTQKKKLQHVPGSKLLVLASVIPSLIQRPLNGYINPYQHFPQHMEPKGT